MGITVMRVLFVLPFLAAIALTACEKSDQQVDHKSKMDEADTKVALITDGREIVEEHCVSCHGIGNNDDSPRTDAPVLRSVLANRDIESLRADFREGIHVGADDMPDFDFGPLGTDAVIAYIESIQDGVPEKTEDKG